jgi:DNA repair exonuclease SbcCD nuclease subunit
VPTIRLIQISDLHLGAPLGWLTRERQIARRREQQRALEDVIRIAIERGAHAILVAGDLFDAEGVDVETLAFAVHAFGVENCPPVFVAPGNHDPYSPVSPYWNPRLLAARGWAWPANVHVFADTEWSPCPLDGAPVTVWGRCFTASAPERGRPLDPAALRAVETAAPERIHVALFHGSLEDRCPPGQTVTAPFSEEEVHRSPFAYLAVGHYHRPSRIEASDGDPARGVRFAYAGSPLALDITETGCQGALEVRIDLGVGPPSVAVDAIPLDSRRIHALEVDVTGLASADQIDRRILEAMSARGIAGGDLVGVRLAGRLTRGVRYAGPGPDLATRAFELRVDARALRPDYDLDGLRAREPSSTEDRFVHALLERLDAETDPERRALIASALYYGLDAFRLKDVAPAYEEMGA